MLYVLEKLGIGVDYIHLFKMMYFAQQNHLVVYGLPLMEDAFKARKHGLVPSVTYKVVRKVEGKLVDKQFLRELSRLQMLHNSSGVKSTIVGTIASIDKYIQ